MTITTPNDSDLMPAAAPLGGEEIHIDEKFHTVLHGWGRVRSGEVHWIDNTRFDEGVAHDVPESIIKAWKIKSPKLRVYVLPQDATDADFVRATNIQPMAPERLAAMLSASDLDALFTALGAERAQAVVRGLNQRITKDEPPKRR